MERELLKCELYNVFSCDVNNLAIDVGNIIKELEGKTSTPVHSIYILKGLKDSLYRLRNTGTSTVSEVIGKLEELDKEKKIEEV